MKQLVDVTNAFELVKRNSQHNDLSGIEPQVLSNLISRSKAVVARVAGENLRIIETLRRL